MAPNQAQELVALCIVETGTAGLYRMLADASDEPDLRRIASSIGKEEIGHYKQFLRYFRRYRLQEKMPASAIVRAVWAQVMAIDREDAFYAFKHVYLSRHPDAVLSPTTYDAFRRSSRHLASRHFPFTMALKMVLTLLALPRSLERLMVPPLAAASRLLLSF